MFFRVERKRQVSLLWRYTDRARDWMRHLYQGEQTALYVRFAQIAFTVGTCVYLVYRLSDTGWREIFESLPHSPIFYLIFLVLYAIVPVCDGFVYALIWGIRVWPNLSVFFRKAVYNFGFIGYSGEAYLCIWARGKPSLAGRNIFVDVKDANILSGLASNAFTAILVVLLAAAGEIDSLLTIDSGAMLIGVATVLAGLFLVPVLIRWRRRVFGFSDKLMTSILLLSASRLAVTFVLLILQWSIALAGVSIAIWATFLALRMLLTRIPFLPNRDLVFAGVCLHFAGLIDQPVAAFAAIFVTTAALTQVLNLVVFAVTSFERRDQEAVHARAALRA